MIFNGFNENAAVGPANNSVSRTRQTRQSGRCGAEPAIRLGQRPLRAVTRRYALMEMFHANGMIELSGYSARIATAISATNVENPCRHCLRSPGARISIEQPSVCRTCNTFPI